MYSIAAIAIPIAREPHGFIRLGAFIAPFHDSAFSIQYSADVSPAQLLQTGRFLNAVGGALGHPAGNAGSSPIVYLGFARRG